MKFWKLTISFFWLTLAYLATSQFCPDKYLPYLSVLLLAVAAVLVRWYVWDWKEARKALRFAVKLSLSLVWLLAYAYTYYALRKKERTGSEA